MISTALSCRAVRGNRGSTLAAALALAFLIFAVVSISLARVGLQYAQAQARHNQTSALFLAEAGLRQAGQALVKDSAYTGETGTRLANGFFNVDVVRSGDGYVVTSTGYAQTPLKRQPRKTVQATVTVSGRSFRISNWRENP